MSVVNPNVRFTYQDYKSLPESMEKRYELLQGDLIMVPAPSVLHQRVSRNLEYRLLQFVREQALGQVFDSPIDVVLGQDKAREVVQPDIVFISHDREHFIHDDEIRGAPDLVVEILSPGTEERDKGYKKGLYARYGVREYWIIDPMARIVEVYTQNREGFRMVKACGPGTLLIESLLLPALQLEVEELFRKD